MKLSNSNRNRVLVNEQIKHDSIRVIDSNGDNLGILDKKEALHKALDLGLDLVMVHSSNNPDDDYPICKIMDYGKYKYNQKVKGKKSSRHTKRKEIFLSMNIGDHDKKTKLRKIVTFLEKKIEVMVSIRLKGRYRGRSALAKNKLIDALQSESISIDDNNWRVSNNTVSVLINP
jgi:translation initiation factor IF-3